MVSNKRIETFLRLLDNDKSLRDHHLVDYGSSREVYELGDMVIKVPRGIFGSNVDSYDEQEYAIIRRGHRRIIGLGKLQTEKEIEVWETANAPTKKLLATIYCHGYYEGMPYIVMEKIDVSPEYSIEDNPKFHEHLAERGYRIVKNYMKLLYRLVDIYGLVDVDLVDCYCNCGMTKDKRLVLCDYGFCGWEEDNYHFEY